MSSHRDRVYEEGMTKSHRAYFAGKRGFLQKGKTYRISYEITPDDDRFVILAEKCNYTCEEMDIQEVSKKLLR